jgi:hypothetical protein
LHFRLICSRVRNELLQIVSRKIRTGDQHLRCVGNQHDRREVARRIVERLWIERLVLCMRTDVAENELIAVGGRARDAQSAGHPACAPDIFNDDLLTEDFGEARREDTSQNVDPAARSNRYHHCDRPDRPVLCGEGSRIECAQCNADRDDDVRPSVPVHGISRWVWWTAWAATTTRQQYGGDEAADNDIVRWRHIHSDM